MFRIEEGDFTFQDVFMNERKGTRLLVNTLTLIDGESWSGCPMPNCSRGRYCPKTSASKVIPFVEVPCKAAGAAA